MKHHGPEFAVLMAGSIGHLDPLLARLRDTDLEKTYAELEFAAKAWAGVIKLPKGGRRQVNKYRSRLCIAAHFLEYARGEPGKGQTTAAQNFAAERAPKRLVALKLRPRRRTLDTSEVRAAVRFAKAVNYAPWRWWDIASRMARKGKLEQLHRTY